MHNNILRTFSTSQKFQNLFFLFRKFDHVKRWLRSLWFFNERMDNRCESRNVKFWVVIYLRISQSQPYSRKIQLVEIVIGCFVTSYKKVLMFYGRFLTNFHELNAINVLWHSYAFDIVCTNLIVLFFLFWQKIFEKIVWHSLMNSIYRNER